MARVIAGVLLLLWSTQATAQLEILASRDFPSVVGQKLEFPRDHGAHPEHTIEWWYFTGHLFDEAGRKKYGTQLTLFRVAGQGKALQQSRYRNDFVVHIGLTDLEAKTFEHISYALPEEPDVLLVSQQDLEMRGPGFHVKRSADDGIELGWSAVLAGHTESVQFRAALHPETDLVLHGKNGVSFKGECPTCATIYSSYPRLKGDALLVKGEKKTPLSALFWYDHEFGSGVLDTDQVGWDWFGINLHDGSYMMAFQLRDKRQKPVFSAGAIGGGGSKHRQLAPQNVKLTPLEYWQSQKTGARYPIRWRVHHPRLGDLEVISELAEQEVVASHLGFPDYYEGNCRVVRDGKTIGHAYLEMNGYGGKSSIPRF